MRIKKILFVAVLSLIMIFSVSVSAADIQVMVNNQPLGFDQPPVIIDGRTVVPVAQIFRSLGAEVEWDGETRTVYGYRGSDKVVIQIDNRRPTVNGQVIEIDVPATIVNGRTMVPARFIAESLGAEVGWEGETSTVTIKTVGIPKPEPVEPAPVPEREEISIHFIDVGQGDATLILSYDGSAILIDAGIQSAGQKVVSYLKQAGVSSIDKVIATHPHADHIGGLIEVFDSFQVGEVIDSGYIHTTNIFERYLNKIDELNIPFTIAEQGNKIDFSEGIDIEIIHPRELMSSPNNSSVSIRMTYGDISFVTTGDAEKEAENLMIQRNNDLSAQIYKVAHHGSSTSNTSAFLDAVNPEMAVFQVGVGNRYGHPSDEVLAELDRRGVDVYRNDYMGNIVVTTDGKTYSVNVSPTKIDVTVPAPEPATEPAPEPDPEPAPEPATEPDNGRVNINTASLEELMEIVHISENRAQDLINNRPYTSLDQLVRISGIAEARVQDIKDQGVAYVE